MTCRKPEVCKDLFAYAKGELSAQRAAEVEEVIATCETCQRLLKSFQGVRESLTLMERPLEERVTFPEDPFARDQERAQEVASLMDRPVALAPTPKVEIAPEEEDERWGLLRFVPEEHFAMVFHGLAAVLLVAVVAFNGALYVLLSNDLPEATPPTTRGVAVETIDLPLLPGASHFVLALPKDLHPESGMAVELLDSSREVRYRQVVEQPVVALPVGHGQTQTVRLTSASGVQREFRLRFESHE